MTVQYITDKSKKPIAVKILYSDWEKLQRKIKRNEEALKLKKHIQEAMEEVIEMNKSKEKKESLIEFLNAI